MKQTSKKTQDSDFTTLTSLQILDLLEIGPVRIEKQRLTMPYRVIHNGREDKFNLYYRYEEAVFDPRNPEDLNLGCLIGAQVALNYGLFFKTIRFIGPFDNSDRRFLITMAANTAREIYIKKFLEPNPYLTENASHLGIEKKDQYLLAQLLFPVDPITSSTKTDSSRSCSANPDLHAVLTSGGKDSLLTHGLLTELRKQVHPVFINESGRHWYTALNAYRYFKNHYPDTCRVWTNADRLFNWMLRYFPFIRKDYASIRHDEYPIRLWTVAVFLFGALPILKKRGIGRLLIGDEYDTTVRSSREGITHYNGLYDQSRFFDNALTRYFHSKGWGYCQFSILRPLSEILIQKILVQRYPDLQTLQVSCHAAHVEGDRIFPCGRCEKCRRIVGMLKALDADPSTCGYTSEQVKTCLEELAHKPVHQEAEGVRHLMHLLETRSLVPVGSGPRKPHPEIMKLRYDSERSPLDTIPKELRKPLTSIFLQYSEGAVLKRGKIWTRIDPLEESHLALPYPFQQPEKTVEWDQFPDLSGARENLKRDYDLGTLTWPEARERFKAVDVALLPVGSIEQHGPHLPLDTDAYDADALARKVARECRDPRPLVLPLIPYGVSYHHEDFSGTLSIGPDTLSQVVYEVGMGAARNGITKLVIINGHGGNGPALHFAAQMINRDGRIFTCVDTGETSDTDINELIETPNDVHAGEIETSTVLASRPALVDLSRAKKFVPNFSSRYLDFSSRRSVGWYTRTARISASGVLGDPTKASKEKGEKIWELMVRHLVTFVEELKRLTLDEIYQKRY